MADYFGDIHIQTKEPISKEKHVNFLKNKLLNSQFFKHHIAAEFFIEDNSIWFTLVIEIEEGEKLFFDTGVEDNHKISFSSSSKNSNHFFQINDNLDRLAKWFSENYPSELFTARTWDSPYSTEEIIDAIQKQQVHLYYELDISKAFSNGVEIFSRNS